MRRILFICLLLTFCFSTPIGNAEPQDEAAKIATELCQVQSLEDMKNGVYSIPEKILNTYFATIAHSNPKVKEAAISVLEHDKIILSIDAEGAGPLRFTCAIKEFHYDKDKASLELYIEKKEVVGHSVQSWFLNRMSLGLLTSIYGNPLNDANIDNKVKGNTIDLDLKPFASGLFKNGIGQSVGDMLVISKVTTDAGIIHLHTNCAINII